MALRKSKGSVSFYLESGKHRSKPIAYSSESDSDWLAYLKPLCNSWEELLSKVDGSSGEWLKAPECIKVVEAYINAKSDFNKVNWR